MTEFMTTPDQPYRPEERYFVDVEGRAPVEIKSPHTTPVVPEANRPVDEAVAALEDAKQAAASRTPEYEASEEELRQAISDCGHVVVFGGRARELTPEVQETPLQQWAA